MVTEIGTLTVAAALVVVDGDDDELDGMCVNGEYVDYNFDVVVPRQWTMCNPAPD